MWKVRWIRLKNHVKKTDPMSTRANVTKCSLNVLLMSPPSAMQTWRMESPIRPFAQVTSLERRMAAEPSTHGTQVKVRFKTGTRHAHYRLLIISVASFAPSEMYIMSFWWDYKRRGTDCSSHGLTLKPKFRVKVTTGLWQLLITLSKNDIFAYNRNLLWTLFSRWLL